MLDRWIGLVTCVTFLYLFNCTAAAPGKSGYLDIRLKNETTVEQFLYQCLVSFIQMMSSGIPSMNIPSFDPWFANKDITFPVENQNLGMKLDVNATKVESGGFSSVQFTSLDVNYDSRVCNMSLYIPSLNVTGDYLALGSYHFFLPIWGNGPFLMQLISIQTAATSTLQFDGTMLSMAQMNIGPMYYTAMSAEFFGLSGPVTPSDSERVKTLMAQDLYVDVERQIRLQLSDALTEYLNEELKDFDASKFPPFNR